MVVKHPCRCNNKKCLTRVTLNKHPDLYVKRPVCKVCGSNLHVDMYRFKKEHKKTLCNCDAFHFPHRAGSSVWCIHHPTGPTEQDQIERYGDIYDHST